MLFFFNDTATTEIFALSLHDALPISRTLSPGVPDVRRAASVAARATALRSPDRSNTFQRVVPAPRARETGPEISTPGPNADRKSTRLNSSHSNISYSVFCLNQHHVPR